MGTRRTEDPFRPRPLREAIELIEAVDLEAQIAADVATAGLLQRRKLDLVRYAAWLIREAARGQTAR